jgi:hypothetical protein
VFFDAQLGFVIEQAVEHIGGIAYADIDDLCVERGVLVRNMRVELHTGIAPIFRIDVAASLGAASGLEPLAVGRRGCAFAPPYREWVTQMCVDQLGQGRRIGFIADGPCLQPWKFGVGRIGTRLGHLGQSQVDPVGQNCRQQ